MLTCAFSFTVICEKNDNCDGLSQFENKSFYVHYQMVKMCNKMQTSANNSLPDFECIFYTFSRFHDYSAYVSYAWKTFVCVVVLKLC